MKPVRSRSREPFHSFAECHRTESIMRMIYAVLSVAFASSGLVLIIVNNLAAGALLTFVYIVSAVLVFRLRRLKIKAGPFEVEAQFK